MSRLPQVAKRYANVAEIARDGVELVIVADRRGARLDAAVRRLLLFTRDDESDIWHDLLGSAKALRWRMLTQPQPIVASSGVGQAVGDLVREATGRINSVGDDAGDLLDELVSSAEAVAFADDMPVRPVLLESVDDATPVGCVVIASNGRAAAGLAEWLEPRGVRVRTVGELMLEEAQVESGYVVGPPRLLPASIFTSPVTERLSFIFPDWFGDWSLPRSVLSEYAEGAVLGRPVIFHVGSNLSDDSVRDEAPTVEESALAPGTIWKAPTGRQGVPGLGEVPARQAILSGGFKIWLDDGERIRGVDLTRAIGEQVVHLDVGSVGPGSYLLLREGQTERATLYEAALELMGPLRGTAERSQMAWKSALRNRVASLGLERATRELARAGVGALDRITSWTEPVLIRPASDDGFERLLTWLGADVQASFELATDLRKKRAQASAMIAKQLEHSFAEADTTTLERDGHLHIGSKEAGFRGVIATKVLSVSPHIEVIHHSEARVLMQDRSARWHE